MVGRIVRGKYDWGGEKEYGGGRTGKEKGVKGMEYGFS